MTGFVTQNDGRGGGGVLVKKNLICMFTVSHGGWLLRPFIAYDWNFFQSFGRTFPGTSLRNVGTHSCSYAISHPEDVFRGHYVIRTGVWRRVWYFRFYYQADTNPEWPLTGGQDKDGAVCDCTTTTTTTNERGFWYLCHFLEKQTHHMCGSY